MSESGNSDSNPISPPLSDEESVVATVPEAVDVEQAIEPTERNERTPDYIVGIGASAGGLEALQQFFENTRRDHGLAYVVVQHLSPDFKSLMRELLSKNTSLVVNNVEDGMTVEANNVYLIPPRNNMIIEQGKLRLIERIPHSGLNLPIDIFFTSLAKDIGPRAIVAVLSGTGTDGSRGLLDIKDSGGIVLVQQPEDAKFDGMPQAAERTGLADVVATAAQLPKMIEQFVDYSASDDQTFSDTDEELSAVFSVLRAQSGIDFSKYKVTTVSRRIQRRMAVHKVNRLQDYIPILRTGNEESTILCRELLINVTRFFRDKQAFADLETEVIDKIVKDSAAGSEIRVWCAGCATGEEAYSIAMLLQESIERHQLPRTFRVFATDVDQEVIGIGAQATYDEYILEDLGQQRIQRFFSLSGGKFQIIPDIRRRVVFAPHDITRDPPFSNMNLVVCRNMLIYLKSDVQAQVLGQLYYSVTQSGFLFLGSSEGLGNLSDFFEPVNSQSKIYRKRAGIGGTRAMVAPAYTRSPARSPSPMPNNKPQTQMAISQAVAETLIDRHLPPSIVFDTDDQAVFVFGEVSEFVRKASPGAVKNNINAIIHTDLQIPVTTAVHRARNEGESLVYRQVPFKTEDQVDNVDIVATALKATALVGHVVVSFERINKEDQGAAVEMRYDASEENSRRLLDLEEELRQTRGHLQITVEELETTNEELQSSNEELMASNEELQSTNEELQSVNEELYTVNAEYQQKIREISDLNGDLTNLLHNTNISVLFLDGDLKIRRYTDSLKDYFNLMPGDLDRPISHTTNNLNYEAFLDDVAAANRTGQACVRIVEGPREREVCVRIEPYEAKESERQGVVISIIANSDVFGLRSVEEVSKSQEKNILLVEDDPQDAALMRKHIEQLGQHWILTHVSSLDEAKTAVIERNYACVLLDLQLPDTDGTDSIRRMANLVPATPIIVVTGNRDPELLTEAMQAGAQDYVEKNHMTGVRLARTITKTLHRKNQRSG